MFMMIDSIGQIPRPMLAILTKEVEILMVPIPEKAVGFRHGVLPV